MERSSQDKWSTDTQASTRKNSQQSTGGWDYVYLKSAEDSKGRLVELQDSQERCSEVSTVLGPVGFVAPITLAVPTRLLPPGAVPVIAGNTIELGDWDLTTADLMAPAAGDLMADGYAFFSVTVCSNYSTDEEVYFRFAIVVAAPGEQRSSSRAWAEIHCWEGHFVRRVADYTRPGGVSFLLFGRPEPMSDVTELLEAAARLPPAPPLLPGWLCDTGQAIILLRLEPPQFDASDKQLRGLAKLPVQVRLSWDPPAGLTPNFRGPLALGRGATTSVDAEGREVLLFPSAEDIRAEFLQQVALDAAVCPVLHFRFGDSLDATVRLPQQLLDLSPPPMPPEEEFLVCNIRPLPPPSSAASPDQRSRTSVGLAGVRLRRLRCTRRCPVEVVRSLDRCGPADSPPPGPRPILVAPMQANGELVNTSASSICSSAVALNFFELALGASANGRLTSFVSGGGATVASVLSARSNSAATAAMLGLMVRVVLNPADPPEALEAAADTLLSMVMLTEHWTMLVVADLRLCAVLCLKQMRLPVAMAFAGETDATAEALDACRFYGVRAIVVPASVLCAANTGQLLLASATERGLAVYATGALSDIEPEVAARLEGIFVQGTFAECRFDSADDSMDIAVPPMQCPLSNRTFCSRFP